MSLQDQNAKLAEDLSSFKLQQTQQISEFQSKISEAEDTLSLYQSQTGCLLAEMACIKANLRLSEAEGEGIVSQDQLKIHEQEKERMLEELNDLRVKHLSTVAALERREEELREQKLEMKKMKMQLTTDMSLLKSQILQLEKDKDELEVQY